MPARAGGDSRAWCSSPDTWLTDPIARRTRPGSREREKRRPRHAPRSKRRYARELAESGGVSLGIAGGACGGDILFHEVCEDVGDPHAALPGAAARPVPGRVGAARRIPIGWNAIACSANRSRPRVLQDDKALPRWLADKPDYDIWQRNNLWMMFNALSLDPKRLTLVALYNREREADGPAARRISSRRRKHGASSRSSWMGGSLLTP